jgi:hypothetical protein
MKNYSDFDSMAHIYLEDSYVIDIVESEDMLSFKLIAVLTPGHPLYTPPLLNEHHCYMDGRLIFSNVRRVTWLNRTDIQYHDSGGEPDRGNIDSLVWTGEAFYVEGDWGQVLIQTDNPPEFVPEIDAE